MQFDGGALVAADSRRTEETTMNVLVVGTTGVLGRNVVPRLVERGHIVKAVVRRREQAQFLHQAGAEPILGDIFDKDSLNDAARGCDVALHLATAIPKSGDQDWGLNDRIRREGTRNFIAAAVGAWAGITALLFCAALTSVGVFRNGLLSWAHSMPTFGWIFPVWRLRQGCQASNDFRQKTG